MTVIVIHNGKKYQYVESDLSMTWIDEKNNKVPVMLHQILREKAINSGIKIETFFGSFKEPKKKKDKPIKLKGFNPLKKES